MDKGEHEVTKSILIAGTSSNAGKTLITSALLQNLKKNGINMGAAKVGPDYIDPQFHQEVLGIPSLNLDLFAHHPAQLLERFKSFASQFDLVLIEGVMGLTDGAPGLNTSSLDVARVLDCPILLIHNAQSQFQSACLSVAGFIDEIGIENCAGVVFNNLGSDYHGTEILSTFADQFSEIDAYYIKRDETIVLPSRHLGLTQPEEIGDFREILARASNTISKQLDIPRLIAKIKTSDFQTSQVSKSISYLAPLGQKIAIARDAAFRFCYPHFLHDWQQQGAELSFFSPLNDEGPNLDSDAVFLPGGYPELHAGKLSKNSHFKTQMKKIAANGALIYGECGGYMVLGEFLIDGKEQQHEMLGLLPITTDISSPSRVLGYRHLSHQSPLPFDKNLKGHEFHFAKVTQSHDELSPLFDVTNSRDKSLGSVGHIKDNVMGSFIHIIG